MLTVVVPTADSEEPLAYTLAALVPAAADGFVAEVVVADAGSSDGTLVVADAGGCTVVASDGGVGRRMRAGVDAGGRGRWLLFLPPGAELESGWQREAAAFIERAERSGRGADTAAVFRFALDDLGFSARLSEWRVVAGNALFGLPAAEQGLLMSRRFYESLGGHRDLPGFEEADLARRIGRGRLYGLKARARVSARLIGRRDAGRLAGYALLALHVPPTLVARLTA